MERLRTPYIVPWHPWPGRCPSARTHSRPRGHVRVRVYAGASARTHSRPRGHVRVRVDACQRPRGRGSFTPGNFKKDATVRPSHGRPRGHRPIVRPSVRPKTSA
jgi:hypothetical protein